MKNTKKLSEKSLQQELEKLSGDWKLQQQKLKLSLKLKSFNQAIKLINVVAKIAENLDHHPNLRIHSYNRVEIEIYTHEVDGITTADFQLAKNIDEQIS